MESTQTTTQRRTYTGATLAEALLALKSELGPEATIVSQRRVRGGPLGLLGKEMYEVIGEVPSGDGGSSLVPDEAVRNRLAAGAALSAYARRPAAPPRPAASAPRPAPDRSPIPGILREIRAVGAPTAARPRPARLDDAGGLRALRREIAELRRELVALAEDVRARYRAEVPPLLAERFEALRALGISERIACEIVRAVAGRSTPEELEDEAIVAARVRHEVASLLQPAGGVEIGTDGPTVLVVVGPTGVGKTTTVAKVGATLALEERRSIAFVSLDGYRIAAADQLRKYAEILGVPFEEANDVETFRERLRYHGEKEVILVDTAGRGPRDEEQMVELGAALDSIPYRSEVHLLVSATTKDEDLRLTARRFRRPESMRLLFTKIDETERAGNLLNLAVEARLPISYIATGQNVPDDIAVADRENLLARILGPAS